MLVASREIYKVNRKRKENKLIMRLVKGSKRISKEVIKANEWWNNDNDWEEMNVDREK